MTPRENKIINDYHSLMREKRYERIIDQIDEYTWRFHDFGYLTPDQANHLRELANTLYLCYVCNGEGGECAENWYNEACDIINKNSANFI